MKKPFYVTVGLFAVPTRRAAKMYEYFCLLLVLLACVAGLVVDAKYFMGLLFLVSAAWYEAAIRWMDNNDAW